MTDSRKTQTRTETGEIEIMTRWFYVVRSNDEFELPVFASEKVSEIVKFMGYKNHSSVCAYFSKEKAGKGAKRYRGPYKLERWEIMESAPKVQQ